MESFIYQFGLCMCPYGSYLDAAAGACKSTCALDKYRNTFQRTCAGCSALCKTCLTRTFCTSCILDSMVADLEGECVCRDSLAFNGTHCVSPSAGCPDYHYLDATKLQCKACIAHCIKCNSGSTCVLCEHNWTPTSNSQSCICRTGMFYSPLLNQCVQQYTCPYFTNQDGSCTQSAACPSGTFPNTLAKICENCPKNCLQCTSLTSCQTCAANMRF